MVGGVLRSLAVEALVMLGTFVGAWAATFAAIYWIAGGYEGVIQGWGLILVLVPFAAAAFAMKSVGAWRVKRRGNDVLRGVFLRVKDHPLFQTYHTQFAAKGLRLCLRCGEMSLNPLARACPRCRTAFGPIPSGDAAAEGDSAATEPAEPIEHASRRESDAPRLRYREAPAVSDGDGETR